jgi:hypothetical protein
LRLSSARRRSSSIGALTLFHLATVRFFGGAQRSSSASRWRRATRSCGVSPDGTTGRGAGLGAGAATTGAGSGAGAGAGGGAASGAPGLPISLRRFTSTTTLLVRPWLKVCLTSPASTERLSPNGLRPRVGLLSVSLISTSRPSHQFVVTSGRSGCNCRPITLAVFVRSFRPAPWKRSRRRSAAETRSAAAAISQRQVDDIVAAQCHRQRRPVQWQGDPGHAGTFGSLAHAPGLVELARPVVAGVAAWASQADPAHPGVLGNPVRSDQQAAGTQFQAKPVGQGARQRRLDPIRKVSGMESGAPPRVLPKARASAP